MTCSLLPKPRNIVGDRDVEGQAEVRGEVHPDRRRPSQADLFLDGGGEVDRNRWILEPASGLEELEHTGPID